MKIIIERLHHAFNLTEELVQSLPEEALKLRLKDLPSNTIGEQLWCVVGARESYLKAIKSNDWVGFSCSLHNPASKEEVLFCLKTSTEECLQFLYANEICEKQMEFIMQLLEHEILHHGQLIRYVYGNKLTFPKSWNERYTV